MNNDIPLLIIGAGSIGERHIRNLWNDGYRNISVYRQRNLPFRDIGEAKVNIFTNEEDVFQNKYFAAFICSPTSQHIQQTIDCIYHDMHVFVEKPLSNNTTGFEELTHLVQNRKISFHTGYMLHYHPFLMEIKAMVENNSYGNLLSAETWWHSYLPNWHPWEDYKNSYAARQDLGGGATITLCHDIELLMWMCHDVKNFETEFFHCTELKLDVDTGSKVTVHYASGAVAVHHISYCSTQEKRLYTFQFENALILFDYLKNEMAVLHQGKSDVRKLDNFERNHLYVDEIRDFLKVTESGHFGIESNISSIEKEKMVISICNGNLHI